MPLGKSIPCATQMAKMPFTEGRLSKGHSLLRHDSLRTRGKHETAGQDSKAEERDLFKLMVEN